MRRSPKPHALLVERVAREFDIPVKEIYRENRRSDVSLARHVAMLLLRRCFGMTIVEIGRVVGNRHHAAVIHAEIKVTRAMQLDSTLKHRVQALADAECPGRNIDLAPRAGLRTGANRCTGRPRRRASGMADPAGRMLDAARD